MSLHTHPRIILALILLNLCAPPQLIRMRSCEIEENKQTQVYISPAVRAPGSLFVSCLIEWPFSMSLLHPALTRPLFFVSRGQLPLPAFLSPCGQTHRRPACLPQCFLFNLPPGDSFSALHNIAPSPAALRNQSIL